MNVKKIIHFENKHSKCEYLQKCQIELLKNMFEIKLGKCKIYQRSLKLFKL